MSRPDGYRVSVPRYALVNSVSDLKADLSVSCRESSEVVAWVSLRCASLAAEWSREITVLDGAQPRVVQEPSADTRGIHEVMFYS